MIANATQSNSQKFLGEIKNHIRKNETFRSLYGNFYDKTLKWTDEEIEISGRSLNMREPNVVATGVGGNLVSQHYDYIIADDLVNLENSATRYQSEKVIDWWKRSLSLLEPTGTNLVVGTRWSYYELYSYLQSDLADEVDFYIKSAHNPDGTLYFPERFSESKLAELKKLHGSYIYCNPYEAPVLMADWNFKPIGEVKAGDVVIGWTKRKSGRTTLCPSEVLETGSRTADLVKMETESGRTIRCTPNHRWWTQRYERGRKEFSPAKVGKRLRMVFDPGEFEKLDDEQKELSYWLGGLFDGDGGFCGQALLFAQDKKHNPQVCKKIEYALDKLGYLWSSSVRPPVTGKIAGRTIKTSVEMQTYWLKGGVEEKRRFLLQCNPAKKDKIAEKMFIGGGRFVKLKDRVTKIKKDGKEKVYALKTETENYIVWGYASSNSAFYENNPIDPDTAIIKDTQVKYFTESQGEKASGVALLPDNIVIFIAVDPGFSEGRLADYTGFVVVAVDERDNWYVLEATRDKVSVGEMINKMFSLNEEYEPDSISLEVIGQGQALLSSVHNEEDQRRVYLPVVEIKSQGMMKKEQRIRAILQPRFERGKVYIKREMDDLFDELIHFPLSQHDDLIDALAQIEDIAYSPSEKKEKMKTNYKSKLEARIKGNKDDEMIDEFMGDDW